MADYPTEEELREIETFEGTVEEWMALVSNIWNHSMGSFNRIGKKYRLATGGWSGNENIIAAMETNLRWIMIWRMSARGGLYIFEIE